MQSYLTGKRDCRDEFIRALENGHFTDISIAYLDIMASFVGINVAENAEGLMNSKPPRNSLRRELGILGATMMGLGSIIGTGIFVSIGVAAGNAGPLIQP